MIRPTEPDAAISELLDGVTQISVDPRNRKQIYVESLHDKNILESLYDYLKVKTDHLDPQITLTFVSSGKKLSDAIIKEKLEKILKITEPQLVQEFIESLNGIGSCSHVLGTVSGLLEAGASQVKGLIDWDGRNEEEKNIVVLGVGHAYAIENIMLDPICITLYLVINESSQYTFQRFCKSDVNWSEWLKRPDLIQASVDYLIQEILELDNSKKNEVSYASDLSIEISQSYLNFRGHDLETLLLQKMPQLKKIAKPQQAGILKLQVVRTIIIGLSEGRLIPKAVIDAFKKLQQ